VLLPKHTLVLILAVVHVAYFDSYSLDVFVVVVVDVVVVFAVVVVVQLKLSRMLQLPVLN
jgi:hypothetical protein